MKKYKKKKKKESKSGYIKKKKEVSTLGISQNKCNKSCAISSIKDLLEEEKKEKEKELEEKGYDYNRGIHTLLTMNMIIPYEFVFYCLLIEDKDKNEKIAMR